MIIEIQSDSTFESLFSNACHVSGAEYIIALVFAKSRDEPPSMMYDASVNGAPQNPSRASPAASGAYYVRMSQRGRTAVCRVTLLK